MVVVVLLLLMLLLMLVQIYLHREASEHDSLTCPLPWTSRCGSLVANAEFLLLLLILISAPQCLSLVGLTCPSLVSYPGAVAVTVPLRMLISYPASSLSSPSSSSSLPLSNGRVGGEGARGRDPAAGAAGEDPPRPDTAIPCRVLGKYVRDLS